MKEYISMKQKLLSSTTHSCVSCLLCLLEARMLFPGILHFTTSSFSWVFQLDKGFKKKKKKNYIPIKNTKLSPEHSPTNILKSLCQEHFAYYYYHLPYMYSPNLKCHSQENNPNSFFIEINTTPPLTVVLYVQCNGVCDGCHEGDWAAVCWLVDRQEQVCWGRSLLTRGLLRGLVERPEDAPLMDRDLCGHTPENTHGWEGTGSENSADVHTLL